MPPVLFITRKCDGYPPFQSRRTPKNRLSHAMPSPKRYLGEPWLCSLRQRVDKVTLRADNNKLAVHNLT